MSLTDLAGLGSSQPDHHHTHALTMGMVVSVLRLPRRGIPYAEGRATVIGLAPGEHRYLVRFAGDPIIRERFIHPDWQADPERALRLLQQCWRAEAALPAFEDFFPEEIS